MTTTETTIPFDFDTLPRLKGSISPLPTRVRTRRQAHAQELREALRISLQLRFSVPMVVWTLISLLVLEVCEPLAAAGSPTASLILVALASAWALFVGYYQGKIGAARLERGLEDLAVSYNSRPESR